MELVSGAFCVSAVSKSGARRGGARGGRRPDDGPRHGIINCANYPLVRQVLQLEICFKALINIINI